MNDTQIKWLKSNFDTMKVEINKVQSSNMSPRDKYASLKAIADYYHRVAIDSIEEDLARIAEEDHAFKRMLDND